MLYSSTRSTLFCLLAALAFSIAGTALGSRAAAQEPESDPIFRRFEISRKRPKFWQVLLEIPVLLRPQGQSDAEIEKNLGFNYVTSFRPNSRVYFSRSLGLAKMEWLPRETGVRQVKVRTIDTTLILNHLFKSTLVTSYGLGIGAMDGIITFNDGRKFETRLEPFIPLQFGLGLRLGKTVQLGLKFSQFYFFRTNPIISNSRLLLGLGFNY